MSGDWYDRTWLRCLSKSSEDLGNAKIDLHDPQLYINRELSLLEFHRRVLEEAQDESNPLLERVKFLAIVGSNLDEFFMVRVAGLRKQVDAGVVDVSADGMPPARVLAEIRKVALQLMTEARECLRDELLPQLRQAGIYVLDYEALTERQKDSVDEYFDEVDLQSAHPAGVRPRASISAYLQPEPEPGGGDPR